eukprot:TRINITY_DN20259_c0_g1_i1.p1 TRINITY_DN20259_c0_g1~~TRINITY_DN20259_c0_g1_i1.p1  ORF type:complete len:145 (+),score=12.16 TRINITY_DN20259_c0_g1_i1:53-487(+)
MSINLKLHLCKADPNKSWSVQRRRRQNQKTKIFCTSTSDTTNPKKVVVVGSGWAGLGASWHLVKQGYQVDLIEASSAPGGMVAGWKSKQGKNVELGIHGYWYPYFNIFSLCDELELNPFTDWTASDQYSGDEIGRGYTVRVQSI